MSRELPQGQIGLMLIRVSLSIALERIGSNLKVPGASRLAELKGAAVVERSGPRWKQLL